LKRKITTTIDKNLCIGCGLCVKVCPDDAISIIDKKAVVTGEFSLGCGHCEAVCPSNAVKVGFTDDTQLDFKNFNKPKGWIKHGDYDTQSLVHLMMSRRSCRNYLEKEVDLSVLEDLVKIGTTAPSGTNSQMWTFTILPDRSSVLKFGDEVLNFFKKLNNLAEKSYLRKTMKFFGKPELYNYYEDYYQRVKEKIDEYEKTGKESLFHGAVSAIIVGCEKGASCPSEDALLASQNILLGAHSMGLGTCLIGFAVEAMKNDKNIKKLINASENEDIYSVIGIGYPDEKYQDTCKRRKINPAIIKL